MITWLRERWLRFKIKVFKSMPFECMNCGRLGLCRVGVSYVPQGPEDQDRWPDCPRCASDWPKAWVKNITFTGQMEGTYW